MKLLTFFLIFSLKGYSYTLEKKKDQHIQKFFISQNNVIFKKNSNFFDEKVDYSLGEFQGKLDDISLFEEILSNLKKVDQLLKEKGKTFNDLSLEDRSHRSFLTLEGFIITQSSIHYKRLDEKFKELQKLKYKSVKSIKLSHDLKELTYIEGSKTKKVPFDFKNACDSSDKPRECYIKDYGYLVLE